METSKTYLEKTAQVVSVCMVIMIGFLGLQSSTLAAPANANVLFILDGSGSMWGRLEGDVEKIVIAKERMTELVQELDGVNMGLIVYGHRRKGDCDDIEMMVPLGADNKDAVIQQIQSVSPKGKTPITKSIQLAAQQLETIEEETEIVLVSDGLETCEGDPCAYVQSLKDKGITFTLDVVGFDISEEERGQLECIAKAGGGRYFSAQNAMQLKEAFTEVKTEVIKKAETQAPQLIINDVFGQNFDASEYRWVGQENRRNRFTAKGLELYGSNGADLWQDDEIVSAVYSRRISSQPNIRFNFKVSGNPTTNWQQIGIILMEDDDNYVRLTAGYIDDQFFVEFSRERRGRFQPQGTPITQQKMQEGVELELIRRDNTFSAYIVEKGAKVKVGDWSFSDFPQDYDVGFAVLAAPKPIWMTVHHLKAYQVD